MSLSIQNNYGTINHIENSAVTINNGQITVDTPNGNVHPTNCMIAEQASIQSAVFTKKTKQENKSHEIILALQQSLNGRRDKARALVQELRQWQRDGYMDSNYNARVMYDELNKILMLPFLYDGFRKYYNE